MDQAADSTEKAFRRPTPRASRKLCHSVLESDIAVSTWRPPPAVSATEAAFTAAGRSKVLSAPLGLLSRQASGRLRPRSSRGLSASPASPAPSRSPSSWARCSWCSSLSRARNAASWAMGRVISLASRGEASCDTLQSWSRFKLSVILTAVCTKSHSSSRRGVHEGIKPASASHVVFVTSRSDTPFSGRRPPNKIGLTSGDVSRGVSVDRGVASLEERTSPTEISGECLFQEPGTILCRECLGGVIGSGTGTTGPETREDSALGAFGALGLPPAASHARA